MRKQSDVGRIYGMKYSWKGHKDRNRHKNRIKRSGQARLVYVKDIKLQHPHHVNLLGPGDRNKWQAPTRTACKAFEENLPTPARHQGLTTPGSIINSASHNILPVPDMQEIMCVPNWPTQPSEITPQMRWQTQHLRQHPINRLPTFEYPTHIPGLYFLCLHMHCCGVFLTSYNSMHPSNTACSPTPSFVLSSNNCTLRYCDVLEILTDKYQNEWT